MYGLNRLVSVSPSYWARHSRVNSKVFMTGVLRGVIRMNLMQTYTTWKVWLCDCIKAGPNMPECHKIIGSIEHFYGHLEIKSCGSLGLCSVEYKEDITSRADEIKSFCEKNILA